MIPKIEATTKEDVAEFERATGYIVGQGFKGVKTVFPDGSIKGMVAFDHWTPSSAQIHVWLASPQALRNHTLIKEAFSYAFNQAGKQLVIGVTPSNLTSALKFNEHIGMRTVAVVKDAWDIGVDMIVTEMRKENCKWL